MSLNKPNTLTVDQEYNATVARIQDLRRQVGLIDVKRKLDAETAMEYEEFKKRVEEKTDFFTKKAKLVFYIKNRIIIIIIIIKK